LLAFQRGEDGDAAQLGALLLAEGLANIRAIAKGLAGG
jgi:hypothetical protein